MALITRFYEFWEHCDFYGMLQGPEQANMENLFDDFARQFGLLPASDIEIMLEEKGGDGQRYWKDAKQEGLVESVYYVTDFMDWLVQTQGWIEIRAEHIGGTDL